jgi:hypothetical protein
MQLIILKNIADELENERFRPEPIALPNGHEMP